MAIKKLLICDQPHQHWYEHIYNSHYMNSPHNSKHLFDAYTLTHIFWNMVLTWVAQKIFGEDNPYVPIIVFTFSTLFEVFENLDENVIKYRRVEIESSALTSYRGDSLVNIVGDLIGNIIGIYLGMILSRISFLVVLGILFIVISNIIGLSYWTELFSFLFL